MTGYLIGRAFSWGDIVGIPTIWNESQIPSLAIAKIIDLQPELDSKLDNTYQPSWNDLSDIPAVLADGAIDYSELINIPAEWSESQIPSLAIAKIVGLQTELNNIQTELNNLLADLNNKLDISYVPDWQDIVNVPATWSQSQIPSLPASKISSGTFSASRIPSLPISKTTGLQSALDGKLENTYQPSWGSITGIPATWSESQIPSLPISQTTGLQSALDQKSDTTHGHSAFDNNLTVNTQLIVENPNGPGRVYHRFDGNNIWTLLNRDDVGSWDAPHPLQHSVAAEESYLWGSKIWTENNFPITEGSFTPYPQGTDWGYTSQGTWSKKGDWVFVSDVLITITAVGSNSVFQLQGFPFSTTGLNFVNTRVRNLTGMPSVGYSQCGFISGSYFRPQYVSGTNGAFSNYSVSQITVGTEVWVTGFYKV